MDNLASYVKRLAEEAAARERKGRASDDDAAGDDPAEGEMKVHWVGDGEMPANLQGLSIADVLNAGGLNLANGDNEVQMEFVVGGTDDGPLMRTLHQMRDGDSLAFRLDEESSGKAAEGPEEEES